MGYQVNPNAAATVQALVKEIKVGIDPKTQKRTAVVIVADQKVKTFKEKAVDMLRSHKVHKNADIDGFLQRNLLWFIRDEMLGLKSKHLRMVVVAEDNADTALPNVYRNEKGQYIHLALLPEQE